MVLRLAALRHVRRRGGCAQFFGDTAVLMLLLHVFAAGACGRVNLTMAYTLLTGPLPPQKHGTKTPSRKIGHTHPPPQLSSSASSAPQSIHFVGRCAKPAPPDSPHRYSYSAVSAVSAFHSVWLRLCRAGPSAESILIRSLVLSRGRDGPCGPPPAQIPASGITAPGSYLG